jgi:hypothetical protein
MPLIGVFLLFLWILGALAIVFGASLYALPDGLLGLGSSVPLLLVGLMALVLVVANFAAQPTERS